MHVFKGKGEGRLFLDLWPLCFCSLLCFNHRNELVYVNNLLLLHFWQKGMLVKILEAWWCKIEASCWKSEFFKGLKDGVVLYVLLLLQL